MDKIFLVGFIGTTYFKEIIANTRKEARKKFADGEGICLSDHIVSKKTGGLMPHTL
jgi:hypothetical protein